MTTKNLASLSPTVVYWPQMTETRKTSKLTTVIVIAGISFITYGVDLTWGRGPSDIVLGMMLLYLAAAVEHRRRGNG